MALALVGGAAIGTLFGVLYDVVKQSMGRTVLRYKPLLGDLKFTLESLRPRIVQRIGDHNVELGIPNDDIESLQRQMEEGIVLVRKLSNIGMWNCYAWGSCCNCTTPSYSDQLVDLNKSLRILLKRLKLQQADDIKVVLRLNKEILDKQDELERKMSDILKVQQEARDVGGSSGSNTGTTIQQGNKGNGGHQVAPLGGVGGAAALGAVLGVLFDTVVQMKDKNMMLKRPLEDVKSTLDLLKPLIEEILNLPKEELEKVRFQMEEGVELLHKCSKVRPWTSCKRHELANKLLGLDESLQGLLNILRVHLAREMRERLVSISKIEKVIDQIEESGTVQLRNDPTEIEDSCDVLEPPQPKVGLSLQGTRDVNETLDSAAKIEVGVKRIEGSGDVQGQTDMGLGEPTLPTLPISEFLTFGSPYNLQSINDEGNMTLSHHSCTLAPSVRAMDSKASFAWHYHNEKNKKSERKFSCDYPAACFPDFYTPYVEDGVSHVSEAAIKSYLAGNPVKSTETYMKHKLELKVSAGEETMKKVMKAVWAIKGVSSTCRSSIDQKLIVVGQFDPALIATEVRKIVSETEVISVGLVSEPEVISETEVISAFPFKEEIKKDKEKMKDNKEYKKERNLTMEEPAAFCVN